VTGLGVASDDGRQKRRRRQTQIGNKDCDWVIVPHLAIAATDSCRLAKRFAETPASVPIHIATTKIAPVVCMICLNNPSRLDLVQFHSAYLPEGDECGQSVWA
jgi:hypothetical protein